MALALYTDTARANAGRFTAVTHYPYWLHDNPTPPTGDSNANQHETLQATATAPTATTLWDYSENCNPDGGGRRLSVPGSTCDQVNWRANPNPTWSSAGPVRLRVWLQGTCSFDAIVRTRTGATWTERGRRTVTVTSPGAWQRIDADITLVSNTPANSRVTVRLDAAATIGDCRIAYDTTTYRGFMWIP